MEVFTQVAKLNSFSKAAEVVYLSQPTISAHISSLEKELGVQLLIRSTKEVYPTKAGITLFSYAQNILSIRDLAIQSVKGVNTQSKGEISILASSVPAQYLLPEVIAGFAKRYPNILVHVYQSNSAEVEKNLDGLKYDFGIIGTSASSNKFTQKPFYHDNLVFVYPTQFALQGEEEREQVMYLLEQLPFVMREPGSGTMKTLESYLKTLDLSTQSLGPGAYFNNTQSVINAVMNGLGVSFVSKKAAEIYTQMGLVQSLEVRNASFSRSFVFLLKTEMILSPIQNLFQRYLFDFYKDH